MSMEDSIEATMESLIETARETVSKLLCPERLSTRFHELKEALQTARCAVFFKNDALGRLDRDIDQVFYDACKLAFESRDLMQLFESKCERALSNVDTIMLHLKDGQIECATNRLRSLHQMSLTMQEKSVEMVNKVNVSSKFIHEITKRMQEKDIEKERLDNLLGEIDLQLMKSRRELKEHAERKEQAKKEKELKEKKMAMSPDKSSIEEFLSWFSSRTIKITSYFKMKVEVQHPDTKEEENLGQSVEEFELASKKQQDSVQDVIQLQTMRTKMVMEKSNMEIIVSYMKKTTTLMDNLKVTFSDLSSFWRELQDSFSTAAKDSELAMAEIKTDPKNTPPCLEYPGVEESMKKFNALWKVLKELSTESKEELKKVADELKSAYTEIISPEETMPYVQTKTCTEYNEHNLSGNESFHQYIHSTKN